MDEHFSRNGQVAYMDVFLNRMCFGTDVKLYSREYFSLSI